MSGRQIAMLAVLGFAAIAAIAVLLLGGEETPPPPAPPAARVFEPPADMFEVPEPEPPEPAPAPARLALSADRLDFGAATLPAAPAEKAVVLRNAGGSALAVSAVRRAGDPAFSVSSDCGQSVAPGARCRIRARWTPAAPGVQRGEIVIAAAGGLTTVTLLGRAAAPPPRRIKPVARPPDPGPPPPSALELAAAAVVAARNQGAAIAVLHRDRVPPIPSPPRYRMGHDDYRLIGIGKLETTYPVLRERVITEDRYIPAILENAVNSQIGGRVIAQVSKHVYGADGRLVLIPAGSRVVGSYEPLGRTGDTRLAVVWTRLLRPDGASVKMEYEGADQMGRTALIGEIDSRLWERYGSVFLLSLFSAATALATPPEDPRFATAQRDLAGNLSQVTARVIEENIDLAPIISVPAGSRINIVPTRDLWLRLPERLAAGRREAAPSN